MDLKPVKHENLKMLIELELRNYIESSDLKDGDKLPPEKELAVALGASRTAVRESLRGLESLGYIESVHGVGWRVKKFDFDALLKNLPYGLNRDLENFREVLEVRIALERIFLIRSLENFKPADIGRLRRVLDRIEEKIAASATDEELNELNAEFHTLLHAPSKNSFLQGLMGVFSNIQSRLSSPTPYTVRDRGEFLNVHRALMAAIEKRDSTMLESALKNHFADVQDWVREQDRRQAQQIREAEK
jgi:GntR family transcriptional repressor for pyruvate dehydrogenase complex